MHMESGQYLAVMKVLRKTLRVKNHLHPHLWMLHMAEQVGHHIRALKLEKLLTKEKLLP